MNELHLFAGAGGGILGGILLGHTCVCAVEIEPYCRKVLLQRQLDGILPKFPIWDDVRTFDGKPWRGKVDVVCGGFPCQDIANGSTTKTGIDGERSGLWTEMRRIVGEVEPRFVFVENSANLIVRGLDRILGGLAALWYDARWGVFSAADIGALHERQRLFILANRDGFVGPARAWSEQQYGSLAGFSGGYGIHASDRREDWLEMADSLAGAHNGVADRVDAAHAIGNGQVPAVVKLAWETLAN